MHRVHELVWDERAEAHIARHHVSPREVEECVFDGRTRFYRTRGGRYLALGVTESGRYLLVVLRAVGSGSAYVITARNMTASERKRYRRESR